MRPKNFSQHFLKILSIIAVVCILGALKQDPSALASNLRFPDLKTLPPRDLRFDRTDISVEGTGDMHNVLRFSNTVYNVGEGKLEMWGNINPITKNGIAYQRVYDTNGTYTDYQVGIFYYHIPHDHYHFENWGQYELWTKAEYDDFVTSGGVNQAGYTNIGTKTTSCVLDEEFIITLTETPFPAVYPWTGCMPNTDNRMVEGLSVGWGDTYDYYRFEQWIDLGQETLADGEYVLRSVSDPLNNMYESPGKSDDAKESIEDNEAITVFTVSDGEIIDSNLPSGTVFINDVDPTTLTPGVTVNVIGRDDVSGVDQVMLSNDGITWATFDYTGIQSIHQSISWNLADTNYGGNAQGGEKTVYAKFKDNAGNFSPIITDTIVLGALPPTSDYSSAVIADNPISYWRLSETSGSTAIDNQGMNHGSYINDPALGSTGLITTDATNTAVVMDGVNDFVMVGNSNSLKLNPSITLEAWIKPESLPSTGTFASIVTKPESYTLQFNGPILEFTIIQNGTRRRLQAPANTISVGQKYHVVGTYDGTTRNLFVNGVLVNSQPLAGGITTNNNNLFIGVWSDSEPENFSGTIDEVAIYGTALSTTRIISHYDVGMGIDTSGPETQLDTYPEVLINTTSAGFTFSSPLATATFECSFDNAAFTSCTSPVNLTSLSDGTHNFQVRAKNAQGLVDQTPALYTWTVDTTAPTVTSIIRQFPSPTNVDYLAFNVTFNEAVTDVDVDDFKINGSTTASITGITLVTTSIYKVTLSGGDLDSFNGTVGLDFDNPTINDLAVNPFVGAEPITDETYVVDNTAPSVTSITRNSTSPTAASSVSFNVAFSESVTDVDASDFSLTTTGVTGASITNVSGSGSTRTVTVNTGSGNGTIRLDRVFNATIYDLTGNPVNNIPFTSGETYTVQKTSAPTNISLSNNSINENQASGTAIGNLSTTDADAGDTFSYAFCGGTNDASFQINGSQLRSGAVFDFETKSSYSICIRSTDSSSQSFDKTFTINVANINEVPVISEGGSVNVSMSENGSPTPFSLTLNATDPENGTLTWSISSSATHGSASATGTGTSKSIGYTPNTDYIGSDTFIVQVSDGTNTDTITVNVTVENVNNPPTNIGLSSNSINENLATGIVIGGLSTTDPDTGDTFTYTFCGGTNDASFQINGSQLQSNAIFDFETKSSYSICIRSTDGGSQSFDKTFTINVVNINEAPAISGNNPVEVAMSKNGSPTPFSLTLNATDPENGILTWSIASLAAHGTASASGTGTSKAVGYIPSNDYTGTDSFIVQVSDGSNTDTITVNVTINAVNSTPSNINLSNASIDENAAAGTGIGTFSTTDLDFGETFTYGFCGGTDDASFQLQGSQLQSAASFDFETKASYNICIRSTDSGALNTTKTFVISINDLTDTATFADVPMNHWAWPYIESLYKAGITGGCTQSPLNYCADALVTRAQMSIFLLKGVHGSSYLPPEVGAGTGFTDVPSDYWAAAWIKQLAAEAITGGCGGGLYCPENSVTRAQMAVFLLKAKYGASYTPPPATGTFADVSADYWAAAWIEQLAAEGITSGCGNNNYCPDDVVTRAQMAVFLVKAFNLP